MIIKIGKLKIFNIDGILIDILEYLSLTKADCENFLRSINKSILKYKYLFDLHIFGYNKLEKTNVRYLQYVTTLESIARLKNLLYIHFSDNFGSRARFYFLGYKIGQTMVNQLKQIQQVGYDNTRHDNMLSSTVNTVNVNGRNFYNFKNTLIKKIIIRKHILYFDAILQCHALIPKTLEEIDLVGMNVPREYRLKFNKLPQTIKYLRLYDHNKQISEYNIVSLPKNLEYLHISFSDCNDYIPLVIDLICNTFPITCTFPKTFKIIQLNDVKFTKKKYYCYFYGFFGTCLFVFLSTIIYTLGVGY